MLSITFFFCREIGFKIGSWSFENSKRSKTNCLPRWFYLAVFFYERKNSDKMMPWRTLPNFLYSSLAIQIQRGLCGGENCIFWFLSKNWPSRQKVWKACTWLKQTNCILQDVNRKLGIDLFVSLRPDSDIDLGLFYPILGAYEVRVQKLLHANLWTEIN